VRATGLSRVASVSELGIFRFKGQYGMALTNIIVKKLNSLKNLVRTTVAELHN